MERQPKREDRDEISGGTRDKGPSEPRPADIGMAMDLGVPLGGSIVGGLVIRFLADGWLQTSPLFTLVGLALGLGAAGYTVWTISKRYLGS